MTDATADWLLLLGHIDDTHAALADLFEQFVAANAVALFFGHGRGSRRGVFTGAAGFKTNGFAQHALGAEGLCAE